MMRKIGTTFLILISYYHEFLSAMKCFIHHVSIVFFLFPITIHAQSAELRNEIGKILRYEKSVDFNVVPGILIGVIDGDSTFQFSFGKEINPSGIYEMGSVSKPFTAGLIDGALSQLELKRSESICTFLPDSLCTEEWKEISINQLINHRAGLNRFAPGIGEIEDNVKDPYQNFTIQQLINDIKELHPESGRYSYSHMGYAMTHWLFEKVGGLDKFMRDSLTTPYSLYDTYFELPDESIEPGHGLDGRRQPPWHTNALKPALGLKSSMSDMITLLRLYFERHEAGIEVATSAALKKELKSLSKAGAYKVVDGWFVISSRKYLVYYHNGRTGGHHVSIAFTPHLRKGVVIIANGAMGSNDLSLLILRMVNEAKRKSK